MQTLKSLQNRHFGSKIKIVKNRAKNNSITKLELFCAKNRSKKRLTFEKWLHFQNG